MVRSNAQSGAALVDAGWRAVFWLGYWLLRAWWFVLRPPSYGAMVAVWCEGHLLVLRQSYRAKLGFPGGSVAAGEPVALAACRELGEELGLHVTPDSLSHVRDVVLSWEHRRDHVSLFELRLEHPPTLSLDNREIVAADFLPPSAVLALPISPIVRAYLDEIGIH
jgi:8-oxo-dGTP diphosphatase